MYFIFAYLFCLCTIFYYVALFVYVIQPFIFAIKPLYHKAAKCRQRVSVLFIVAPIVRLACRVLGRCNGRQCIGCSLPSKFGAYRPKK